MAEEPPCVLVVDDDPDLRTALAELISAAGYHVLTATNGRDAVVLAAEHPPRLVLLDLVVPVMDGHAALAALRDLPTRIPVVCMSASLRARAAAEQHAVAGYLEKPVGVDELLRVSPAATRSMVVLARFCQLGKGVAAL
jgi:CheY-like chemotaxis protein